MLGLAFKRPRERADTMGGAEANARAMQRQQRVRMGDTIV